MLLPGTPPASPRNRVRGSRACRSRVADPEPPLTTPHGINHRMTRNPPSVLVPLHVKSHYSLGCGKASIRELVHAAASAGLPSLALTDLENLYGQIQFHHACGRGGGGMRASLPGEAAAADARAPSL